VQFSLNGQSGVNALGGVGGDFDFFQPIGIEFSTNVNFASILALDVGEHGLILEAFNAQNISIDSDSIIRSGQGVGEFDTLSVSGSGISRLEIRQLDMDEGTDGYVIDDLRFSPIPEPSSTVLLGVCLMSVWMRRRRI
jgi:hypothetical protein